jgi:hypothetical protein
MLKYGFKTATTFFVTFGYLAVSVIIIAASLIYISGVDWQGEISLFPGILDGSSEFIQE